MKKKILVVGLGLIGSSLALTLKKNAEAVHIIGLDQATESEDIAKEQQIIDEIAASFREAAEQADVILLAIPVRACIQKIQELKTFNLKPDVIVTDACSTKSEIMQAAAGASFTFVGGHPMAGSHKSGVLAADVDLFENAYYIFTAAEKDQAAVDTLQSLLAGSRAKYVSLEANEHDEITGMLSHLPHIIAAGLVNQSDRFNQVFPRSRQLAAGGFRDITRIASSDPTMWTDILLSNRAALLHKIDEWEATIDEVRTWICERDEASIYQFFESAKETRDQLPVHEQGAIPAFYDLLVDVPDVPGVIAEVTGLLGQAEISIINLRIQETREDIVGILQITFKTETDLAKGKECLEKKTTYTCRIK
ncbi:prephenate dehydrogenase [Enterococcus sp. JM4C]|uniref:prephenate dehydrogenase n=1 Tax=Candidatus Enterococcus huntleyi TaxID=1857217 RepID=UPI00137B17B8|nr:prephenate dehydrogenase [Enterococcus sp. JM4C]KAF1296083.1 prephenate dehydrogenase [Enterococcus sp. JM4C]